MPKYFQKWNHKSQNKIWFVFAYIWGDIHKSFYLAIGEIAHLEGAGQHNSIALLVALFMRLQFVYFLSQFLKYRVKVASFAFHTDAPCIL